MRVEVTPLMKSKQATPPISVKSHDDKYDLNMDMKAFKGKYVFLNFWISASPACLQEQNMIQEMYKELQKEFPDEFELFSINVDEVRKKAIDFIKKNRIGGGRFGFTDGVEHRTLFDFGIRSYPSYWLIGKDGKILMSQYEVAQAMRVKPTMAQIVSDRINGKDAPTPATQGEPTKAEPKK